MPQDRKAIAEARALQACIQVTTDPVEQNRLWNRYYSLSDVVFPEAAALHKRYKSLAGAERQRFKTEYMELVRRLWAATDPQAAYPVSFSETPDVAPTPKYAHHRQPQLAPASTPKPRGLPRLVWAGLAALTIASGATALWQYGQSQKTVLNAVVAVSSSLSTSEIDPAATASLPPVASLPVEPAPTAALELGPAPEFAPPLEKIDSEVAQAIMPALAPVPESLKGKGDRITVDGVEQVDVYVIESENLYYVRVPERGVVESVAKESASASISADTASREALLAIWNQNRDELDRVAVAREKEKAERLASYRKAFEQQVADHKASAAAEQWRARCADWLALGTEQRNVLRVRAYDNWESIQIEVAKVEELYFKISRAYTAIGISDERVARLTNSYNAAQRSIGPNFEVEDALIEYGFEREDWVRMVVEWETEYYRLTTYLNETYPNIEKRVDEIKRLDESLPADVRVAETMNWDGALEPKSPGDAAGGTGTGFVVAKGFVMTCAHVVRGGGKVTVISGKGVVFVAKVHELDMGNDWALLEVSGLDAEPIPVSIEKPNVGATIYCIGYPLGGIQGSTDPIVGSGNIAALQRIDGDQRFMQITAPVNPGNSGGPVLDQYGRWVGIVSQKMNDMATLQATETVTQGINFAVKASFIQPLVQPKGGVVLVPAPAATGEALTLEAMVQKLAPSIVKIEVR
jgi:hypothetical protein